MILIRFNIVMILCFTGILTLSIYMHKKTEDNYFAAIFACGLIILVFGCALVESYITSTEQRIVYLEQISDESEHYYHYTNNKDYQTIEYLKGTEMVTLFVDKYKLYYDSNDKPYMEVEENKNFFGRTVQTKVTVHLEKLDR